MLNYQQILLKYVISKCYTRRFYSLSSILISYTEIMTIFYFTTGHQNRKSHTIIIIIYIVMPIENGGFCNRSEYLTLIFLGEIHQV